MFKFLRRWFPAKLPVPVVPEDGMRAYAAGYQLQDNPYPKYTAEHSIWRDDWLFSHRDNRLSSTAR